MVSFPRIEGFFEDVKDVSRIIAVSVSTIFMLLGFFHFLKKYVSYIFKKDQLTQNCPCRSLLVGSRKNQRCVFD